MDTAANMKVLFIAGFGPIVRDMGASRKLYRDLAGIPFTEETDGYLHTEAVSGANSTGNSDPRIERLSNACEKQEGTVGTNREPFHLARRTAGRDHFHSIDAGTAVATCGAGFVSSSLRSGRASATGVPSFANRWPMRPNTPFLRNRQ